MAIGKFNVEVAIDEPLKFDTETLQFDSELDQYIVDTLGQTMRELYQEREYSRVNKIVSIVGKDLSINGQSNLSKYAKSELEHHASKLTEMIDNQKPPAFN